MEYLCEVDRVVSIMLIFFKTIRPVMWAGGALPLLLGSSSPGGSVPIINGIPAGGEEFGSSTHRGSRALGRGRWFLLPPWIRPVEGATDWCIPQRKSTASIRWEKSFTDSSKHLGQISGSGRSLFHKSSGLWLYYALAVVLVPRRSRTFRVKIPSLFDLLK